MTFRLHSVKLRITIIPLAILIFFYSNIIAQNQSFILNGKVLNNNEAIARANIEIYSGDHLINTLPTKVNGTFSTLLEINQLYNIKVIKTGFIPQIAEISTNLNNTDPATIQNWNFTFTFYLIEDFEDLNTSLFNKPISKYYFNAENGRISEDINYKKNIDKKIKEVQAELAELREKAYNEAIENSKNLAREGDLKKAFENYRESYYKYYKDEKIKKTENKTDSLKNPEQADNNKETKDIAIITENKTIEDESKMKNDSLKESISEMEASLKELKGSKDEKKISIILPQLADAYLQSNNIAKAIDCYNQSLNIEMKQGNDSAIAELQSNIALAFYDSGQYEQTIDYLKQSLQTREKIGDKEGIIASLSDIATVYENNYEYNEAVTYYNKAIDVSKDINDYIETSVLLSDLGLVYYMQNDYENTIQAFEESLELDTKQNNSGGMANTLNNIGVVYYDMGEMNKAGDYYDKAYAIEMEKGDKEGMASTLINIGNIQYDLEKYKKALEYYKQSLTLNKETGKIEGEASVLHNIANVYIKLNKIDKAIETYIKSSELATMTNYYELLGKNYQALYTTYFSQNNCALTLKYVDLYNNVRWNYDETQKHEQMTAMNTNAREKDVRISRLKRELEKQKLLTRYEADRREKEVAIKNLEIRKNEAIAKKRKIIAFASIGGLFGVLIFSLFLYREYTAKRKSNEQLKIKNQQISAQKKNILDSITYASRIQNALLPPLNILNKALSDFFILYKPRDIVSGDFYWIDQRNGRTVIVAADCTGHGVPGAFMSMLGFAFLNEIVNRSSHFDSAEILNELRERVITSLHQSGKGFEESKDGMDITICVIDKNKQELQFSGAYNPIYLIRKNELSIYKGDKMPIAIHEKADIPFSSQRIKVLKDDIIYMFSDGYADQFGGPDHKKFMIRRFQNLLVDIHGHSMQDQKVMLDNHFNEWKGNMEQMDDILVIGLKV